MSTSSSSRQERRPLLTSTLTSSPESLLSSLPVYDTIHLIHQQIIHNVDVALTTEQLRSPEITFAIIHPLELLLAEMEDISIVYVLLLTRLHFLKERDSALSSSSLNQTRADLCEVLAIKMLRHQATMAKGGRAGLLAMSGALVGGFTAFQGADEEVIERVRQGEGHVGRIMTSGGGKTTALELAILSKARHFIKSSATQVVISAIWDGRIVYSSSSFLDILPDKWKHQEIRIYDLRSAPLLDHYRLRVPKYRSIIDFVSYLVLFSSFLLVIIDRHNRRETRPVSALSASEIWFFIYALGYSLDKVASILEHGFKVFSAGLTNGLDAMSIPFFFIAAGYRFQSVIYEDPAAGDQAFAVLSCCAVLMFPRLAFTTISNNVLILSLRAMLADFAWLMGIAVFCFLGFVFALSHLCDGEYSVARIAEWLVFIWFGLDGTGIDVSNTFHPVLGPALFIIYAALSNTLLVSLLVAILSGTYAGIAADAAAEDMFRKAVMTFEGVKADSLFDYMPPLNLIALMVMYPISKVTTPRWFHKINVATTRVLSFPALLMIAIYERQTGKWVEQTRARITSSIPTKWAEKFSLLEGAHWECEAVFEYGPLDGEEKEDEDDLAILSSDDEVENLTSHAGNTQRNRISSRASHILSSNNNLPSTSNRSTVYQGLGQSNDVPKSSQDVITDLRTSNPGTGAASTSSQPIEATNRPPPSTRQHDRLPSNHSAISIRGQGSDRTVGESVVSFSAPHTRFESPLSKLYQQGENGVESAMLGIRRRMSQGVSGTRPTIRREVSPTTIGATNDQLREMIEGLAATLARLEARMDEEKRRE